MAKKSFPLSLPKNILKDSKLLLKKLTAYRPKSYTPILFILLIVAAFLLGVLFTKVQYLEKGQSGIITATGNSAPTGNTAGTQPAAGTKVNVGVGNYPPQGKTNAKVKIIEFADLRCPFCEQFFTQTESQIIKDYVNEGKAAYYYRNFAFLGDPSVLAANAAECANEQNKFWQMHDYFYKNQPPESDTSMYTVDNLTTIAGDLGMNTSQFNSCLSSKKYQKNVDQDLKDGQTAGVSGTPSLFINGEIIVGACPFTTIKGALDAEIAHKQWSVDAQCQLTVK